MDEATHAFYLGRELLKAKLAITLGKTYRQEGALAWGYLTPPDDVKSEHVKLTPASPADPERGPPAGRSADERGSTAGRAAGRLGRPRRRVRPVPRPSLSPVSRQRVHGHPRAGDGPAARPLFLPLRRPRRADRAQQGPDATEVRVARCRGRQHRRRRAGRWRAGCCAPFAAPRRCPGLPPFQGGVAGYIGYD